MADTDRNYLPILNNWVVVSHPVRQSLGKEITAATLARAWLHSPLPGDGSYEQNFYYLPRAQLREH